MGRLEDLLCKYPVRSLSRILGVYGAEVVVAVQVTEHPTLEAFLTLNIDRLRMADQAGAARVMILEQAEAEDIRPVRARPQLEVQEVQDIAQVALAEALV